MMEKSTTQFNTTTSTQSWSSYFTWAAKAFALLSGVGGIGIGMMRYFQQDDGESTRMLAPDDLSLLPKEEHTAGLLSTSDKIVQAIPDTTIAVSLLEIENRIEEKSVEDPREFSESIGTPTHFSERHLRSTSTVLNPIPDQVINVNEIYDFTIDPKQVFGKDFNTISITGSFPAWMSNNYYPRLANYPLPGNAYNVKVIGTKVYVADGTAGLYILDVSNLSSPIFLGRYDTPNIAYDVEVFGNVAYVADGSSLQVLNIANAAQPTFITSYQAASGMRDITLNGNLVYIPDGVFLHIFNVSDFSNVLVPIGRRVLPSGSGNQAALTSTTAYVAATTGTYNFNINPPNGGLALLLGTYSYPGGGGGVTTVNIVNNTIAYVGHGRYLDSFDLANPLAPRLLLNNYDLVWNINDCIIQNEIGYICTSNTLKILNLSNPINPTILSTLQVGNCLKAKLNNSILYLLYFGSNIGTYDVTDPTIPRFLNNYHYPLFTDRYWTDMQVVGNFAYVTNEYGLTILDVSNWSLLVINYDTPGSTKGITVVGSTAYVASSTAGLHIIDVANPTAPILLSAYNTPGDAGAVTINRNLAYVYDDTSIQIINIANLTAPILVGTYAPENRYSATDVDVVGSIAYITWFNYGLDIVYIGDFSYSSSMVNGTSASPFPQGSYSGTNFQSITAFDTTAIVGSDIDFSILSTATSANFTRLSKTSILAPALSMIRANQVLYISEGLNGMQLFNIANTSQPVLIGYYDTPGSANGLTLANNNTAFIADGLSGLQIVSLSYIRLQGIPGLFNIADRYTFTVTGIDSVGNLASDTFIVSVARFPVVYQAITPPQPFWANKLFNIVISSNTFANPDTSSNPLSYAATLSDNSALPLWLYFNTTNVVFSGITPNVIQSTTFVIKLTATNTLGGYVATTFPLIVNPNHIPVITGTIPFQFPNVDQPYNYFIPQGMFSDPEGDPLLFSARFANSTGLPDWLNFNPISATFSGLPHGNDIGNFTVIVSATDNIAGSVSTSFGMYITYLPQLNGNVPQQVAGINIPYQYPINKNIFSSPSGGVLIYNLKRQNGLPLPQWLQFNASSLVLSGIANSTYAGTTTLQFTANDVYQGSVSTLFDLIVENFPVVQNIIPNQVAGINLPFSYTIPAITFADAESDTLTYQAALASGSSLPNWLNWNSIIRQLSGTAASSDKGVQPIRITAIDPFGGFNSTTFNLTIENFPTVANPIPAQIAGVNVTYIYTIPANTFADADSEYLRLALGNALPAWLNWTAATTQLRGTPSPADVGVMSVQITATDPLGGAVTNTFSLRVENFPYVNQPIPNQVAGVNQAFYFSLPVNTFRDADADVLTYQAALSEGSALPIWLNWNALAQQFTGTPLISDRGIKNIRITATDPFGGFASTIFNLTIENFPAIQIPIPNQLAGVDIPFSYIIPDNTFVDIDGEALTYHIQNALPDWLNWNAFNRQLQGTPRSNNTGLLALQVIATDPLGGFATTAFNIKVENFPRVAHPIPNQFTGINQAFDYDISQDTFVDEDTLSYQAALANGNNLPNWLNWNALTQQLSGTPLLSDRGIKTLRITATDPFGGFAQAFFNITVTNLPVLANPIPDQLTDVNVFFSYTIPTQTFVAPDGDSLTYAAQLTSDDVLPSWLNWQALIRRLSGTPTANNTGVLDIKIIATNRVGYSVSDTFLLRVDNFPRVNRIVPNKIAGINLPLSYTLATDTFNDEDGDTLSYQSTLSSGVGLPNWLSFNPTALQFTGTPLASDRGVNTLRVIATDPFGGLASTTFNLTVENLPVLVKPIGNLLAGVNKNFSYILPQDTFSDADDNELSYSVNLLSSATLPAWLNWTVGNMQLQGIPQASDRGILNLQLTATDPLGAFVSDNFNLRVEYFPQFNHPVANQVAGVNLPFTFTLPADTFTDADGELLTYSAKLLSGAALPNWMQWDSGTQKLKGTPLVSDVGVNTIQIIATDPLGATASGSFQLSVIQLPILNHPITPPASFREGKPFTFIIPPDAFTEPNHLSLSYAATLSDDASLPAWLSFNSTTLTFSGTPTINDEGNLNLQIIATNSEDASVTAPFTFHIVPNAAPIVANSISNLVATVGISFKFVVPADTFSDPNGDTLTYTAQLSDGSPLPTWLNFEGDTFAGTPGGWDTNFYQVRVLPISLKASDGTLSTATAFNITVGGTSIGEEVVKIVGPVVSALGTAYGLYRKRALILNNCCKKRYQKLEDTAVVGEAYSRELETPVAQVSRVEARFQRNKFQTCARFFKCQTNGMPGGALLPDWLGYNEATNTIYSKGDGPREENIGTLIIQVRNTDGVIQEQFTLKVVSAEHALTDIATPADIEGDDYNHRFDDVPLQNLRRVNPERDEAAEEGNEIMRDAPTNF